MRLLHCSDLHLRYLDGTRLIELCNKRLTGALNLVLGRAKQHRGSRFETLIATAKELQVDHILVSGDLINLGMKREFLACTEVMRQSAAPFFVVPGNHDIYLSSGDALGEFAECFAPFLGTPLVAGQPFPYQADLGPVRLFGLNSSVGRPWFLADGQLGAQQLNAFEQALSAARSEGKYCVIMLHHPVTQAASRPRRDLMDRGSLAKILASHGADLILHGHEHRQLQGSLPGPCGLSIPVHGVASATATSQEPHKMGAFTLYEMTDRGMRYQRFRCETPSHDEWTRVNPPQSWDFVHEDAGSGSSAIDVS